MPPEIFAEPRVNKPKIKYGGRKVRHIMREKKPAVPYPWFDRFADLLDSENSILKWGAVIILGNLAAVDSRNKTDEIVDRYLQPISGSVMITAANSIDGAGKMVPAKPHLANKVVRALLQVEAAHAGPKAP